jgi:hypothetical protein
MPAPIDRPGDHQVDLAPSHCLEECIEAWPISSPLAPLMPTSSNMAPTVQPWRSAAVPSFRCWFFMVCSPVLARN